MAYLPFSKVKTSRFKFISTKKKWCSEFEPDYKFSESRINLTENCLLKIEVLDETLISRLAKLIRWASDDEVVDSWSIAVNCKLTGDKPKIGHALTTYIQNYGLNRGTFLYDQYTESNSTIRRNGASQKSLNYWIKKGYSEVEAELKISELATRSTKIRWETVRESGLCLSEYSKSINPISIDFNGYIGLSEKEIEVKRKPYLEKCIQNTQYYIDTYGEELGLELQSDRYSRRMKTMLSNDNGIFKNNRGSASRQSLSVFQPLVDWLVSRGYNKEEIYLGGYGCSGERWLRCFDNKKKYFFYDFTLLNCNVMVEYHGIEWHPKNDYEWASNRNPRKETAKDKRNYDLHKKDVAERAGFTVLEIWSDEDVYESIERCKELILKNEELYNQIAV